jgi:sulfur dioxygenase
MILRQLIDGATSTLTYLVADPETKDAVLIDSVFEQHLRDLALVRELGLTLRYTLETHVHADHVTAAWLFRESVGSAIVVPKRSGAEGADRYLGDGEKLEVGSIALEMRATPGHTEGCASYVIADEELVFSGDALLIRGAGRTDFQQGDAASLFASVRNRILSLPDHYRVYPGHDYRGRTVTTVAEERAHNPRLGDGVREEDFVGYMQNLGLPHPKRMADAVPANLLCGKPKDGAVSAIPDWGPVIRTFAGVWETEPEWVAKNRDALLLVDVREQAEVEASPLNAIGGSINVPLSVFRDRVDDIAADRPVVLVCPAGARSAIAATILEKTGIHRVANMRGGLIEWRSLGLPLGGA